MKNFLTKIYPVFIFNFIILSAFIFLTPLATCSTHQISTKVDYQILWSLPVIDQGPLGTCYAITASQLMQYQLGLPALSPFEIALNHKSQKKLGRNLFQWEKDSLQYSYMTWAFDDLSEKSFCVNKADKVIQQWNGLSFINNEEYIYLLEIAWKSEVTDLKAFKENDDTQYWIKDRKLDNSKVDFILTKLLKDVENFRKQSNQTSFISFLSEQGWNDCDPSEKITLPELSTDSTLFFLTSKEMVLRKLKKTLTSKPVVGVGYCYEIWEDKEAYSNFIDFNHCDFHYSLAAYDSENHPGELLVRNSYGNGFWTKEFDCECGNRLDGSHYRCDSKTGFLKSGDETLGCWLPLEKLSQVMFDLEVLNP